LALVVGKRTVADAFARRAGRVAPALALTLALVLAVG